MSTAGFDDRPRYRPSGRVNPAGLIRGIIRVVAGAAGIAALYCVMVQWDAYVSALSVIFPVGIATGVARAAVRSAHCRNRCVAAILAVACGCGGYLGYFHLDHCLRWNAPWSAVDALPGYIGFRMQTDSWEWHHKAYFLRPQVPVPGMRPAVPLANARLASWTWAGFGFELLLLTAAPAVVAIIAASAPYSERRRRWCSQELLVLERGSDETLRTALAERTVRRWVESSPRSVPAHEPHAKILVWYTPADPGAEPDPAVFVSFGDRRRYARLAPDEAAALVGLLPALRDLAGSSLEELAAEAERTDDGASACVWPVPAPYAGQSQNVRNKFLGKCLLWTTMTVPGLLAVAIHIGGTCLLHEWLVGPNLLPEWTLIFYVIGVGLACLAFLGYWHNPERPMWLMCSIGFDHWLIRRAIATRPESLVAADDPEAIFAEMAPRRCWTTRDPAHGECNQGLLRIDDEQRVLWFEGDYHCYAIPADAILTMAIETLPGMPATTAAFYFVVLHARLGSGTWEFPFVPLSNIEGANHWERATALYRRIQALRGNPDEDYAGAEPPRQEMPLAVG